MTDNEPGYSTATGIALCEDSSPDATLSRSIINKKGNRPCRDESQKIIKFLLSKLNETENNSETDESKNSLKTSFRNLQKEILSVCRRIKRAGKSTTSLLDVLSREDESKCLIIKRNLDGRIQVDGRKVWPHAFMYHIYVTFIKGDTSLTLTPGNHSELRTKSSLLVPCQYPFAADVTNEEQTHLCINPFHYEEKLKIDINHYILKRTNNENSKAIEWRQTEENKATEWREKDNESKNLQKSIPTTPSLTSSGKGSNSDLRNNEAKPIEIEQGLLESLSSNLLEKSTKTQPTWAKPLGPDVKKLERANKIIKYNLIIASAAERRSIHNSRSRSPNRRNQALLASSLQHHVQLKNGNQDRFAGSEKDSPMSDDLEVALNDIDLSHEVQQKPTLDSVNPENIIAENDDYYIVSRSVVLNEQTMKPWTQITYYEASLNLASFSSNMDKVNFHYKSVNGSPSSSTHHFDLSTIKNINRSASVTQVLEKITKGISIIYDRERRLVSVENLSSLKVYILSYLMNVDCGKHEQSLIQILPKSKRVVYDGRLLATTIDALNSQTDSEVEKWALVGQYANYFTVFRISFEPWGPRYIKKKLTECDIWLEVQMREYWEWIQNLEGLYDITIQDTELP